MKKIVLVPIVLCVSLLLQAQVQEDKIEYNKEKQACLVMEYSFSSAAVENAILSKMDKLGYKGKEERGMFNKDKGFRVYKKALIAEISSSRFDYILNIERKSRKENDESVMYLIIMKEGANALQGLSAQELGKAKSFLYNLLPDIEAANLELQIKDQEEIISKSEKKLKSLQSDKEDMEKKIKKLQDDVKQNEKDQEDEQKELENQKKILEALLGKRKN